MGNKHHTGDTLNDFEGSIQINNVSFSYPSRRDVPILSGINIHIKPGQTVALVGPSGCGKSTIVKLLQRIYDFNSGLVRCCQHDNLFVIIMSMYESCIDTSRWTGYSTVKY